MIPRSPTLAAVLRGAPAFLPAAPALRSALAGLALAGACCGAQVLAAPAVGGAGDARATANLSTRPAAAASHDAAGARLREIIERIDSDTPRASQAMEPTPEAQSAMQPAMQSAAQSGDAAPDGMVHRISSRASDLVVNALGFLGVRYRYGGDRASKGFDCSGFVRHVYQETLGLVLPHNAAQQSHEGVKVAQDELRPGDLVFFNTLRRAFSHVGIYIGNGQFVHAPRPGENVQIANLDSPYWARRFDGARRLITRATDPLLSAAQAAGLPLDETAAAAGKTLPAVAVPPSNAVPAGASPPVAELMSGAVLPGANAAAGGVSNRP